MYTALGCHVFAGGFTRGVQQHDQWRVLGQLELHDLGRDTVKKVLGLEVFPAADWNAWPRKQCDMLFGNPRCTGFSCVTSGHDATAHGPWANQTKDAHDLMKYAVSLGDDAPAVICWESVQQAYSVGKPLLDYMLETYLKPMGYRVAHLFVNAASFGNAQQRKRYFMVAYRGRGSFNVSLPELPKFRVTLRDVIEDYENRETRLFDLRPGCAYDPDCSLDLPWLDGEWRQVIKLLPRGYSFNTFAAYHPDKLPPKMLEKWNNRTSQLPFSMHCPYRVSYDAPCPTLWGSCQYVHPVLDRLLTVRELSLIMGWDFCPVGPKPIAQIAKGIVPAVGSWLAEQARLYLDDAWGGEDFASSYDAKTQTFMTAMHSEHEKVFRITDYTTHVNRPELADWQNTPLGERPWALEKRLPV